MTDATDQYLQQVADKVAADWKRKKSFEGRRNRSAFKRMNRPSKLATMERGAEKFMKLLSKITDDLPVGNEYTGP